MTDEQIQKLVSELQSAEYALDVAKRTYAFASSLVASAVCPYKLGDLVEIKGHSYAGMTGIVKEIRMVPYLMRYQWEVEVVVLKDNGEPSANRTQFREHGE